MDKLSRAGAELLIRTLPALEQGTLTPEKQPLESPTAYARMIRKEDGRIDWNLEAEAIERRIRGLNPWPSAYTELTGKNPEDLEGGSPAQRERASARHGDGSRKKADSACRQAKEFCGFWKCSWKARSGWTHQAFLRGFHAAPA